MMQRRVSLEGRPLLIMEINVLLSLEVLLLPLLELPSLQQLLIGTAAVQRDQFYVLAGLLLGGGQKLLQGLLVHEYFDGQLLLAVVLFVGPDEVEQHLRALFDDEGDGPSEEIHEVGQQVGVWTVHELLDVESVVLGGDGSTSNLITAALLL